MIVTPIADERYQLVELDEDHANAHAFNMLFMVWRRRPLEAPFRRGVRLVH